MGIVDRIREGFYYPRMEEIQADMQVEVSDSPGKWEERVVVGTPVGSEDIEIREAISAAYFQHVRIPLLTREDIVSAGWEFVVEKEYTDWFKMGIYELVYDRGLGKYSLIHRQGDILFKGMRIPTIYHFRSLMQMAGIKKEVSDGN